VKKLSKTNYILYRDCAKNAWVKIHKPEMYNKNELSQFEKNIIETGNEIDKLARSLFPGGILVENREDVDYTKSLVTKKTDVIYQPVFETDKYMTASDILVWNAKEKAYDLFEVKASNSGEDKSTKDKLYSYDLAFQYIVLKSLNVPLNKTYIIRLNNEYVREGELNIHDLFTREDFSEKVLKIIDEVATEMENAYKLLSDSKEPFGSCKCILRGKSSQCTTFKYSNPNVPEYSVHHISKIGLSKRKLEYLVDNDILDINDVPADIEGVFELSENQRNQVRAVQTGKTTTDVKGIGDFLSTIQYPISFLDYETFAAAVPRFSGYSPFNQIPFQFSLHVLEKDSKKLKHEEFIFTEKTNPDEHFIKAMQKYIPNSGSIISWHKSFEMGRNVELGKRNPKYAKYLDNINSRMIDLEDPFKAQMMVHPDFKGKTSIKYILPALTSTSYKDMNIKEGGSASDTWNKIVTDQYSDEKKKQKIKDLLDYCELDTKAMYDIWKYLDNLINN
jgi:hypothetical protein